LLGRSHYEDLARTSAASPAAGDKPAGTPAPPTQPGSESVGQSSGSAEAPPTTWNFYRSGEPAKTPELAPSAAASVPSAPVPASSTPAKAPVKAAAAARAKTRTPAPSGSALIPKGSITLQVAALLHEADALALAQALQEKKFPAIVTTPSTDKFYRVQVGPYPDTKSATAARRELEKQGFKSIVRR
jgi:cell division septation protein DedD